jgi:hypothetical protein
MEKPLQGYTVGVTDTLERVTVNLPPDEMTPAGAVLLFTPEQARAFAALLYKAANLCDTQNGTVH